MTAEADLVLARRAVRVATRLGGHGLGGLRLAFERAGESAAFDTWVACGPNGAVSAAAVLAALPDAVQAMARATGRAPEAVAATLAEVLPTVVDGLTPDGVLPRPAPGLAARFRALWRSA